MALVRDRAERGLDQLPAPLVVERGFDGPRDERASPARADAPVELFDELVAQRYVQSHAHNFYTQIDALWSFRESRHGPGVGGAPLAFAGTYEREYSFVDATSFALMRSLRIKGALAFDGDFGAAGFTELHP